MLTDALSFGAKAQKILDISDLIYPALHPQKSSQHLRACAARVGAICSKNKEKLSYITGTALILELARDYGLRPRLRLLLFFALALFFFGYNPEEILGSIPETTQVSDFLLQKMYSISLKLLRQQFNFQNCLGNIEVRA